MHISIELYIYMYVPKGLVTDEVCWKHVSKYHGEMDMCQNTCGNPLVPSIS